VAERQEIIVGHGEPGGRDGAPSARYATLVSLVSLAAVLAAFLVSCVIGAQFLTDANLQKTGTPVFQLYPWFSFGPLSYSIDLRIDTLTAVMLVTRYRAQRWYDGKPPKAEPIDAAQSKAILLAHHYQESEIQELADWVGDSLELARKARDFQGDVIAFCGVWFMAETAKILNPERTGPIPDVAAGCSLADSITAGPRGTY